MRRLLLACLLLVVPGADPARAQRAWQPPVQISGAGDTSSGGGAVAPGGRVVTAWSEVSAGVDQVWVAARPGMAPVLADPAGRSPAVAVSGSDEAAVAWLHDAGPGQLPRTHLALWTPDGGLSEPVDLGESGFARPLALAANARGDMVIAFILQQDYSPRLHTAFRPAGGSFGEPVAISGADAVLDLDVALGNSGEAVFGWVHQTHDGGSVVRGASRLADGPPTPPATLSAAGRRAFGARTAADDLGRGIVTFREEEGNSFSGWVRAAVKSPAGTWAAAPVDGYTDTTPAVAADADGDVVLTWSHFKPTPDGAGGQIGPVRVATGSLAAGAFQPGLNVDGLNSSSWGQDVAMRADGTAVLAWSDFSTGEVRTARRTGTGPFGPAQTVRCPSPQAVPQIAGIDAAGTTTVFYRRIDMAPSVRPWWLVQDTASATGTPSGCAPAARKGYPLYDPVQPLPGRPVAIDVEGTHDPAAPSTTWRWDMDADGTFETNTGTTPVLRHTWATAGTKTWRLAATTTYGQGGAGTAIWDFSVTVGGPGPGGGPPPAPGPAARIEVAPRQRLRTVLRRGLRVSVSTRSAGAASLELWADAKEARRLRAGRRATRLARRRMTMQAGAPTTVRLRLRPSVAKRLRRARRAKLVLGVVRDRAPLVRVPLVLGR